MFRLVICSDLGYGIIIFYVNSISKSHWAFFVYPLSMVMKCLNIYRANKVRVLSADIALRDLVWHILYWWLPRSSLGLYLWAWTEPCTNATAETALQQGTVTWCPAMHPRYPRVDKHLRLSHHTLKSTVVIDILKHREFILILECWSSPVVKYLFIQ